MMRTVLCMAGCEGPMLSAIGSVGSGGSKSLASGMPRAMVRSLDASLLSGLMIGARCGERVAAVFLSDSLFAAGGRRILRRARCAADRGAPESGCHRDPKPH